MHISFVRSVNLDREYISIYILVLLEGGVGLKGFSGVWLIADLVCSRVAMGPTPTDEGGGE